MTNGLSLRVLHLGKFYPPVSGGMERVLQLVCDGEKSEVETSVLVAGTQPRTVRETIDDVRVTRAASLGMAGSVAVCPTLPLLLSRERADILVIHEPNPMALVAYALVNPACKVIVWFHSEVVRDPLKYALFYKPWFVHAMRRASRVIVASPPMMSAAQLRGFEDKAVVIPYGIDERRFSPSAHTQAAAARLRRAHPGPLILFVGRLVPYKGLEVLLQAMVDVPATAVLVGDGPQRSRLETLATELGITSKVVFAGELAETDLMAWYHACDIFALPSVTRAEAFGVVQAEAMICGKPVVSTALPTGVPWVNRDGESGLVVPPGDSAALSSALRSLVEDPRLRLRLGAGARRRAEQEFIASRMVQRVVNLYRDVAADVVGAADAVYLSQG
jgi:rhamnosyl/mannosyltransferase